MPRLHQNFSRCVGFLYGRDPQTDELRGPVGTALLVGFWTSDDVHSNPRQVDHLYAVTCAHVAPQGASILRINTNDGKSRLIELTPDDWEMAESGADLAAADIRDEMTDTDAVSAITPAWFADKAFIEKVDLGIGSDGYMLGLFAEHPGVEYNRIAAKFGNISLMADENEPIGWKGRPPRPAHLFDIRSRGGFSGSPVFVYRTPEGDLRNINDGMRRRTTLAPTLPQQSEDDRRVGRRIQEQGNWEIEYDTENNIFLRLLGIHAAQYPERVRARKLTKAEIESASSPLKDGDEFLIEGGTTIVVPAWEVTDLLNRKTFVDRRTERHERVIRERPNTEPVDESAVQLGLSAIEGDERHKERFTSLLDAAVGKPKQGG